MICIRYMFQSLIGRLQTGKDSSLDVGDIPEFQSLIGRLQTLTAAGLVPREEVFQSLIGRLQTFKLAEHWLRKG